MNVPNEKVLQKIWVGFWMGRRHVVFDPELQPTDKQFIRLYFVEGKSLCCRSGSAERMHVKTVRDKKTIDYAIDQYDEWKRRNQETVSKLISETFYSIQDPDAPRKKCSTCNGDGITYTRIGTFSEGAFSDGVNERDVCRHCDGKGFVANIFEIN